MLQSSRRWAHTHTHSNNEANPVINMAEKGIEDAAGSMSALTWPARAVLFKSLFMRKGFQASCTCATARSYGADALAQQIDSEQQKRARFAPPPSSPSSLLSLHVC